ncbi:hypothetical protein ACRPL0_09970, partial [Streptococcus uberis]|uniref:hypothetical protein n=1 Tax=Streptococcus uberis TaxID=1349 RepID=UPI003D77E246
YFLFPTVIFDSLDSVSFLGDFDKLDQLVMLMLLIDLHKYILVKKSFFCGIAKISKWNKAIKM